MALGGVTVFVTEASLQLGEMVQRRKLDEDKDGDRHASHGRRPPDPPRCARAGNKLDRGKREGQEQDPDIFCPGGNAEKDAEQDRTAGRRSSSNLINAASARMTKGATTMSSLKMRACTVTSGVAAVAAAAAKVASSGSTSLASLTVAKTSTPPANAAQARPTSTMNCKSRARIRFAACVTSPRRSWPTRRQGCRAESRWRSASPRPKSRRARGRRG